RIEYKREGARLYKEMQGVVQDRTTDLVFRARLTPEVQARSVYQSQQARHDEADSLVDQAARSVAEQGDAQQQADLEAAQRAGSDDRSAPSRRQRRAGAASGAGSDSGGGGRRPRFKRRKSR
ncbi:MAG: hypothetical protein R3336_03285, partial [Phycisphaeraceae bacterium]|nr:hypothetical protein [Phycisphaeraceae bacterium]